MASALFCVTMIDEILTSSFDGNAARDTLPPETPTARSAPSASRPFPIRAYIPSPAGEDLREPRAFGVGFIDDQRLADLLFQRAVRRVGPGLVEAEGRRYRLHNAVRVVGRREPQMTDPYGLAGTVERYTELVRAGAQFTGSHMQLGPVTYRVQRGVLVVEQGDVTDASARRRD